MEDLRLTGPQDCILQAAVEFGRVFYIGHSRPGDAPNGCYSTPGDLATMRSLAKRGLLEDLGAKGYVPTDAGKALAQNPLRQVRW